MNKSLTYLFIIFISSTSGFCQTADTKVIDKKQFFGISVHRGLFGIAGDIPGGGFASGLRFHFPVNKSLSLRVNALYGTAKGLSYQVYRHSNYGGGLLEYHFEPYRNHPEGWYPSYHFRHLSVELEGLISIIKIINETFGANIQFMDLYFLGGYGLISKQTKLDLLDKNGMPYESLLTRAGTNLNIDVGKERNQILKNIEAIYDGNYETEVLYKKGKTIYSFGSGLTFKVNKMIDVGVELKAIIYPDTDYIDGIRFRTALDQPNNSDAAVYMNLYALFKF